MKIIVLASFIWSCQAGTGLNPKFCRTPTVPNAQPVSKLKPSYSPGETLRFVCDSGFEFEGTHYALCNDGTWRLPLCKEATCTAPHVPNAKPEDELVTSYGSGRTVRFICYSGYKLEGTPYALCEDGAWSLPVCIGQFCGPHPAIRDGNVTEIPGGLELKVRCLQLYKLEGPERVRCVNGTWTEFPVCKPPCKLDRTQFSFKYPDEYLQEGEEKTFFCRESLKQRTVRCFNGEATYSECK